MHNIWAPQDNKFVTELQVLLEQIKFNIRRIESDLKINSTQIESLKIKIETLEQNILTLRDVNTKIVSIAEYRTIIESLKSVLNEKWMAETRKQNITKNLDLEQKKIPIIESEIEKVKFKLLKFKKI